MSDKCPECKSSNLIHDYDSGEIICKDCGLVLPEPMIDEGPEWRAYTEEEGDLRSRVGAPTILSIPDKGLSTTLEPINRDALGRILSPPTFYQMKRLSKHQRRSRVHLSIEQNLALAMAELDRLSNSDKLSISPLIKEKAAIIYRKTLEKGFIRGRTIKGMVAASLYLAYRDSEIPISLQEIANVSLVDKKEIARCYRLLIKKLDFKVAIANPIKYISKFAEKIGISVKTQGRAIEIIRKAKEKKYGFGKDARSLAAGALYIACQENNEQKRGRFGAMGPITQKDIADAAGVTEVTLRNRYKELVEVLKIPLKI